MVCFGNICRSPIAEGVLKDKFSKRNLDYFVDSAGLVMSHVGESPDPRAIAVAGKNNIDISQQKARQIHQQDFLLFDKIYALDMEVYKDLISRIDDPVQNKKVDLLMNASRPESWQSVPDPYYSGENAFVNVFN